MACTHGVGADGRRRDPEDAREHPLRRSLEFDTHLGRGGEGGHGRHVEGIGVVAVSAEEVLRSLCGVPAIGELLRCGRCGEVSRTLHRALFRERPSEVHDHYAEYGEEEDKRDDENHYLTGVAPQ